MPRPPIRVRKPRRKSGGFGGDGDARALGVLSNIVVYPTNETKAERARVILRYISPTVIVVARTSVPTQAHIAARLAAPLVKRSPITAPARTRTDHIPRRVSQNVGRDTYRRDLPATVGIEVHPPVKARPIRHSADCHVVPVLVVQHLVDLINLEVGTRNANTRHQNRHHNRQHQFSRFHFALLHVAQQDGHTTKNVPSTNRFYSTWLVVCQLTERCFGACT